MVFTISFSVVNPIQHTSRRSFTFHFLLLLLPTLPTSHKRTPAVVDVDTPEGDYLPEPPEPGAVLE